MITVWLLVATLHVGMTGKQGGGYTQWVGPASTELSFLGQDIIHSPVELCMDDMSACK